ncbi:hypothetical protein Pint_20913 [Pistacia integerrima]|uniref:Uncharacterized protein n=1 Tax=Pistacia integerrima TaxID=434235 RepID=A0ACC0X7J8_9ROSI|nr:hypothetical protein Pint_20913 [Pistacia integerrima]
MEILIFIFISIAIPVLFKFIFNLIYPTKNLDNKLPPGPSTSSIIVNFLRFYKSFGDLERLLLTFHAKFGPIISLPFGSKPAIFIADHSLAHQALVEKGAIFSDRPQSPDGTNQNYISTAFYGSTWRLLRRNLTAEILDSSHIKSFSNARKWVLQNLLDGLKLNSKSDHPIIVMDYFLPSMFSLLGLMCFGKQLERERINELMKVQRRVLMNFSRVSIMQLWPRFTKIVFRKQWDELVQARQQLTDVWIPIIRHRKKMKEKENQHEQNGDEYILSYVDTLLELQHPEEKRNLNEEEIVHLSSEFLNAGTDTTSALLQWTMANLVKYQHIQEKLFMEIKGVVGDNAEYVKEEDLQKMPYLKAVILEVLRRHPPGRINFPRAVSEDTVLNGYVVPKNGTVNFMIGQMAIDPEVWESPLSFRPERFLRNDNYDEMFDITGSKEIKMIPFGAGRRICPGMSLAILHLEYFVANLVWRFEWKCVDGEDVDMEEKLEFSIVMKNPLQAHVFPRLRRV